MKSILLSISCLISFATVAQEVPNGNFEIWDYYNSWTLEPQYWETPNGQLIESVLQDSMSAEGVLAMRVTVLPGFEGGVPQTAMVSFLADTVATHLRYKVKTNIPEVDESDQVSVAVELLLSGNVVYTKVDSIFETMSEWQLRYLALPNTPILFDGVHIVVTSGYHNGLFGGSWDTWISIDDIRFETIVGVQKEEIGEFQCYPNPAKHMLNFVVPENLLANGMLVITDEYGKIISNAKLKRSISVEHFAPGIYHASLLVDGKLLLTERFVVAHE